MVWFLLYLTVTIGYGISSPVLGDDPPLRPLLVWVLTWPLLLAAVCVVAFAGVWKGYVDELERNWVR